MNSTTTLKVVSMEQVYSSRNLLMEAAFGGSHDVK